MLKVLCTHTDGHFVGMMRWKISKPYPKNADSTVHRRASDVPRLDHGAVAPCRCPASQGSVPLHVTSWDRNSKVYFLGNAYHVRSMGKSDYLNLGTKCVCIYIYCPVVDLMVHCLQFFRCQAVVGRLTFGVEGLYDWARLCFYHCAPGPSMMIISVVIFGHLGLFSLLISWTGLPPLKLVKTRLSQVSSFPGGS